MRLILGLSTFGLLWSAFLGRFAVEIFEFKGTKTNYQPSRTSRWWIYQFVFNFMCCMVGWTIAAMYLKRYIAEATKFAFTGADAVPLLVGLLGITGLLPRALWAFSELAGNLSKKLTS